MIFQTTVRPTWTRLLGGRRRREQRGDRRRGGFSLVEILVTLVIIGTLASIALPAMQQARESSRRSACVNNLRNCAAAVLQYESARQTLPPGSDQVPRQPDLPSGTQLAWSAFVLPFIEQTAVANRFSYAASWNAAGGNDAASDTWIDTYVCPSGHFQTVGKADYGGVSGNVITMNGGFVGQVGTTNGLLVPLDAYRSKPVRAGEAADGLSQTLLVAESVDRCDPAMLAEGDTAYGRWAWMNHFAQSTPAITMPGSDIHSHHVGGANVTFGDGRVVFLGAATDPVVLAAVCTRNGGEAAASAAAIQ